MKGGGGGGVKCGHADWTLLGGSSGKELGEEDKMKRAYPLARLDVLLGEEDKFDF